MLVLRHRPDEGVPVQLRCHARRKMGAAGSDLRHCGGQYINMYHLGGSLHAVHIGNLLSQLLGAVNALLDGFHHAKAKVAAFHRLLVIGNRLLIHAGVHSFDLQQIAALQLLNDLAIRLHRTRQIDAIHQTDLVQKCGAHIALPGGAPGPLQLVEKAAQVVALYRNKSKAAIQIHCGAFHNGAAAGAQNSIRQLQFRHGGTTDVQGIGWLQHRQGGGIGIRQLPCGGKAGLEVCAGGIKVLLGGNAANHGAVYFHLQGKVQVQPMGNHSPKYHPGGTGGKPWHQLPQRVRPGQRGAECLPQLQHRGKQQPDKIKRSIPRSVRRGGSLAAQADEPIFC